MLEYYSFVHFVATWSFHSVEIKIRNLFKRYFVRSLSIGLLYNLLLDLKHKNLYFDARMLSKFLNLFIIVIRCCYWS